MTMSQSNLHAARKRDVRSRALAPLLLVATFVPSLSFGCACGCGVFDVGTGAMFPNGAGGLVFAEVDYMDQKTNWSGTSSAPADNNSDKEIKTQFYTVGV